MANEIRTAALRPMASAALPTGWLDNANTDAAVASAMARYSRVVPREIVSAFAGDGTGTVVLSTALATAGWVDETCTVLAVSDSWTLADPAWLEPDEWEVVADPTNSGKKTLVLESSAPGAADTVCVRFQAPHGDTTCTVRADHQEAVASLVAAILCRVLAARHAPGTAPTIGADTWSGATVAGTYLSLAKQFESIYAAVVGETPAAGGEAGSGGGAGPASAEMRIQTDHLGWPYENLVGFDGDGD